MIDREKVIDGLNETISYLRLKTGGVVDRCIQHQYDALELLKEQEALKPIKPIYQGDDSYLCDNCGETVGWEEMACCGIDQVKFKYCPGCGRKVKWDE